MSNNHSLVVAQAPFVHLKNSFLNVAWHEIQLKANKIVRKEVTAAKRPPADFQTRGREGSYGLSPSASFPGKVEAGGQGNAAILWYPQRPKPAADPRQQGKSNTLLYAQGRPWFLHNIACAFYTGTTARINCRRVWLRGLSVRVVEV